MAENQELLSRISHLAGQINLHKGRQQSHNTSHHTGPVTRSSFHTTNYSSYDPYRDRTRAHVGKYSSRPGFRNRSLVVKKAETNESQEVGDNSGSGEQSDNGQKESWVSKRDRHLQLINTSHYDPATRTNSPPTRKRPEHQAGEHDKDTNALHNIRKSKMDGTDSHRLHIEGITFRVSDGGSKLVREDDTTDVTRTPDSAVVGGVEFRRDHNGDLRRMENGSSRRPCKRFSNTGECSLGPRCAYVHDPNKVAVCNEFLRHGTCKTGSACNLSHDCSYERVPACSHFQRGKCTRDDCRYAHVRVNPTAGVCKDFSALGYCQNGSACPERHVFECPAYSSTGECPNPACRLPHVDRASRLRQHGKGLAENSDSSPESRKSTPDSDADDGRSNDRDDVVLPDADHTGGALDGETNFIHL